MSDETVSPEWIATCLGLLREPAGSQVVVIGNLPPDPFDVGWPGRVTGECVLIKERRRHYLEQHSDLDPNVHEPLLLRAIHRPDEVHRNVRDQSIAIIYQSMIGIGIETHYLRIALWISDDPELKNSVHSMRIARRKEVLAGRGAGRKVWP